MQMNNFAGKDYFLCQMFDQLASFYYLAGVGLESAGGGCVNNNSMMWNFDEKSVG